MSQPYIKGELKAQILCACSSLYITCFHLQTGSSCVTWRMQVDLYKIYSSYCFSGSPLKSCWLKIYSHIVRQSHFITQLNSPLHYITIRTCTFLVYSHSCPRLQCGHEPGLSWGDGDLHLHCQPGSCTWVDCWAIHLWKWYYPVSKYYLHWQECKLQWCCSCAVCGL